MKFLVKIRLILFIIFFSFLCLSLTNKSNSDDPRIGKISKQIDRFSNQYRQQKVHLQTDKDVYLTGETIWIKANIVDAMSFQADTISKNVFVELADQSQRVAGNLIMSNKKGVSEGYILLRDTLLEGNYQLRACTSWMRNFDPDFFFSKTIRIKNPGYADIITKSRLKEITGFNADVRKKENVLRVSFFPEGGDLVAGLQSLVAFKAENDWGTPQDIKGTVLDNKGKEVVSFEGVHDGMGTFMFTPQPNITYNARVTFSNGTVSEYPLPGALIKGITMSVDPSGKDDLKVTVRQCENSPAANIIIVVQSRNQIHYISQGLIGDKPVLCTIPKKLFPPGIAQITLFGSDGKPVCERLVFIRPEPEKNICNVELISVPRNDSIIFKIKVSSSGGDIPSGNLSLSVTEDPQHKESTINENILTDLLLTSDIKGRINNPAYYFDSDNPDASRYLDLVMLTNGWRRFIWKDLLADKFPLINYPGATEIFVSGSVFGDNNNQPVAYIPVVLSLLNNPDFSRRTSSDIRGKFAFPALVFEDSADVKIEAVKSPGETTGYIALDQIVGPGSITKSYPLLYNEIYDKEKIKENTKRENLQRKKQPKTRPANEDTSPDYYTPSFVLKVGEDANSYSNIIDYISGKIPGLSIINGRMILRGSSSLNASNEPLFILERSQVDLTALTDLNPRDVDRVEVLKGDGASAFGSRGSNGVLIFRLKSGNIPKRSSIEFKINGYQKIREFYIPPYESLTYKPENFGVPRTLFWKPEIVVDSNGEAIVRFKNNLAPGKLNITLEGLTDSGEIVYKNVQQ